VEYILPMAETNKFEHLFAYLDSHKQGLGIKGYGISLANLEDVFIRYYY